MEFNDYLIFVDESGSPSMGGSIDPQYPLFVSAFLLVKKSDYAEVVCPAVSTFKFKHFGHDQVILHERDMRKDIGAFRFFKTPANSYHLGLQFGLERVLGFPCAQVRSKKQKAPAIAGALCRPGIPNPCVEFTPMLPEFGANLHIWA